MITWPTGSPPCGLNIYNVFHCVQENIHPFGFRYCARLDKWSTMAAMTRKWHFTFWQLRPNSWTKSRQKSWEFFSLLFTVTSTALPWDLYFFKLTQPLTVSRGQLLNIVKEKRDKPDRKPYPFPYGLRNPYRILKSKNSQNYAQIPQQNFTFLNWI